MKTKSIILSVIMLFSFVGLSAQEKKNNSKETVTFNVPMSCENCQNKIEKNIAFEKGVKNLSTDLEKQTATVTFDVKKTNVETLQAAFQKIGYKATLPTTGCCASKTASATCLKSSGGCAKACPNKTAVAAASCCVSKTASATCLKSSEGCAKTCPNKTAAVQ